MAALAKTNKLRLALGSKILGGIGKMSRQMWTR